MTPQEQPTVPGRRTRGRFAPSPTGPLHLGSLVAAIASYLQAKKSGGEWLLRIEDIDPPREVTGASDAIIRSLEAHGFEWDGPVIFQSRNTARFNEVADDLLARGKAFACTCSREEIRLAATRISSTGPIYPGTCRQRMPSPAPETPFAIRINTAGERVAFCDRLQGRIECNVEHDIGDFVIRRKDNLIAYSLAVVVDDFEHGITEIVRGADLLDVTPGQIMLQKILGLPTPAYCHIPLVMTSGGQKLSKQTGAAALDDGTPSANLVEGLRYLGQSPPDDLGRAGIGAVWSWALANWDVGRLEFRAR